MKDAENKPAEMYGISRETHAWKVVLKRDRVQLRKQFSFNVHQGEEAALLWAGVARRDGQATSTGRKAQEGSGTQA